MKNLMCLFLSLLVSSQCVAAKVLIITHSYNRPDFIEMQSKMFKHFMLDEYEFVVFSDAKDEVMNEAIIDACKKSDVRCIRMPQELHKEPYLPRQPGDPLDRPNIRHANVVQYSMDILGFDHQGPVVVLDSDMFLVRPLSVVQELESENWDMISFLKGTDPDITHLCPAFMIFSMDKLPNKRTMNFNCGTVKGASVDSGGHTYYYLQSNPTLKIKGLHEIYSYRLFGTDRFVPAHFIDKTTPVNEQIIILKELGFNEKEIAFLQKKPDSISFLSNHYFLHYRAGSNYDNQSKLYDQKKMALINEFFDDILTLP